MTNKEILESINDIDSVVLESEMNVIKSLIDSYSKSLMILENYEGDNLDSFEIFSESFIMEADDNASTEPKESIIKKILLAIPRLFKWLADKIRSIFKKAPIKQLETEIDKASKIDGDKYSDDDCKKFNESHPDITITKNSKPISKPDSKPISKPDSKPISKPDSKSKCTIDIAKQEIIHLIDFTYTEKCISDVGDIIDTLIQDITDGSIESCVNKIKTVNDNMKKIHSETTFSNKYSDFMDKTKMIVHEYEMLSKKFNDMSHSISDICKSNKIKILADRGSQIELSKYSMLERELLSLSATLTFCISTFKSLIDTYRVCFSYLND